MSAKFILNELARGEGGKFAVEPEQFAEIEDDLLVQRVK